jgi:SAM-dependent methyltransferase
VNERETWERHWSSFGSGSTFGKLAALVRKRILSRAVRRYTDRFFPREGTFVECGCGTGQSSTRVFRNGRRLIAADLSLEALQATRRLALYSDQLQTDIRRLPLADDSVGGIWNLGVMEHFGSEEVDTVLREFRRVLKPGHVAILFWPPDFGSSRLVLAPIEWLLTWRHGRLFRLFPSEPSRLRSRNEARKRMVRAGFEPVAAEFGPRDAFIHVVVVGRKPET